MNITIYDANAIKAWELEIATLTQQKADVDNATNLNKLQMEQEKQQLQDRIDKLNQDVTAGTKFLKDLDNEPQELVKQLGNKILTDLTGYTSSHSELSIQIRICMYELKQKLDYIQNIGEKGQPAHIIKIQYVKLCALVQDMYEVVRANETHEIFKSLKLAKPAFKLKKTDPAFIKLLEDILESSHIGIGGTLPDKDDVRSQKTGDYLRDLKAAKYTLFPTAMKVWDHEENTLKYTHNNNGDIVSGAKPAATGNDGGRKPEKPEAPVDDRKTTPPETPPKSPVGTLEEQYNKLLNQLRTRPVVQNALQTKINHAVDAVDAEVRAKKQRNETIAYDLYIRLLDALWRLSQTTTPTDAAKFIDTFTDLTKDVTDTHSIGKQVAGVLLMIVGLLLIAASIATLVATYSGSSIVSSVGIALGVSLLSSEMVLSATAGVTGAVGAGLTFWGVKKFNEGQGRELAQAVVDVREELAHLTPGL